MKTRNAIALGASALSLVLSSITFPTAFLLIPIFVFPPLAFICGALALLTSGHSSRPLNLLIKFGTLLLMALAIGVFIFWFRIVSTTSWH